MIEKFAENVKTLVGHVSPETAFLVEDYPYGFTLRCKIRYWLEYRKGFGYRFVSQTTNPKKSYEYWNKPKAGNYHVLAVMVQNVENGYIGIETLRSHGWSKEEDIKEFENRHAIAMQSDLNQAILKYIRLSNKISDSMSYEIVPSDEVNLVG